MRIAGLFLLISGWLLAIASVYLLQSTASEFIFVFISVSIQILGLAFLVRTHTRMRKERP